jgi:stearoyl-CoA desaturase (delta-9 desaturase)
MNQRLAWLTMPLIVLGYVSAIVMTAYSISYDTYWLLVYCILYQKIVVGLIGNQIAQHRYFSHNSFKTSKFKHYLLGFFSILTGTSPITYASIHRHHHIHSDTDRDVHSPRQSFWYSALYWPFTNLSKLKIKPASDLIRDPYTRWLHININVITVFVIVALSLINPVLSIGYLVAIGFNNLDATVFRSALVHIKLPGSYKSFYTNDSSWNNKWLQLYHWSEGLHNNHHAYPNRYNTAVRPGEFDLAGWCVQHFFENKND